MEVVTIFLNRDSWKRVKFGDVIRKVREKADRQDMHFRRFVAGEHMVTDQLKIRNWGEINNDYLGPSFNSIFKPGQVLYGSRRTYLRKVAVPDFEGITSTTTFVLESKDEAILLQELLPFIMQMESFHAHSIKQSKGGVNPYINYSDLVWFEFLLPPLDVQEKVVRILQANEELINSLHDLGIASNCLYQSALDSYFGYSSQISKMESDFSEVNIWKSRKLGDLGSIFFSNVDKKFIADLYEQYDLLDALLPMTRHLQKKLSI